MNTGVEDRELMVTLVHGTWPGRAGWTRDGAVPLWQALAKRFGKDNIKRIDWGRFNNSQPARLRGALILRDHIAKFPKSRHILIGHSHGGNVILYALRDQTIRDAVVGVICIGTPFVRCRPSKLGPLFVLLGVIASTILLSKPLGLLVRGAARVWGAWIFHPLITSMSSNTHHFFGLFFLLLFNAVVKAILSLLLIASIGLLYVVAMAVQDGLRGWADNVAQRIAIDYEIPSLSNIQIECYGTNGDEAKRLLRIAARPDDLSTQLLAAPVAVGLIVVGFLFGVISVVRGWNFAFQDWYLHAADVYGLPFDALWQCAVRTCFIIAGLFLMLLIATVIRDGFGGYGHLVSGFTWLVRLRVKRFPHGGEAHYHQYEPRMFVDYFGWFRCMRKSIHSLLHEHPVVAEDVAEQAAEMATAPSHAIRLDVGNTHGAR